MSFSFTSCRVTSIPGGGCLLLDCTLITILTPPLLHWPDTASGIEHLKVVLTGGKFEYNVQSVARIFNMVCNYIQARRHNETFPRKKAAYISSQNRQNRFEALFPSEDLKPTRFPVKTAVKYSLPCSFTASSAAWWIWIVKFR